MTGVADRTAVTAALSSAHTGEHTSGVQLLAAAWTATDRATSRRLTGEGEHRLARAVQVAQVSAALGAPLPAAGLPDLGAGPAWTDGAAPSPDIYQGILDRLEAAGVGGGTTPDGAGSGATARATAELLAFEVPPVFPGDDLAIRAALAELRAQPGSEAVETGEAAPAAGPADPAGVTDSVELVDPAAAEAVATALGRAYGLLAGLWAAVAAEPAGAVRRDQAAAAGSLLRSVVRPLGELLGRSGRLAEWWPTAVAVATPVGPSDLALAAALLDMAVGFARSAAAAGPRPATRVVEAAAGLQRLTQEAAAAQGTTCAEESLRALAEAQPGLDPAIRLVRDGPYLAIAPQRLVNHLGHEIPVLPLMALCRCGRSTQKPYCDGSHARSDFTDGKDPSRVADSLDSYTGQIKIHDNRGVCAHSGRCTDRVPTVFHLGEEPFVTPSGARIDEIMRAVRSCPSGALSYSFQREERCADVDQERPQQVEVSLDGPYRITGGIPLEEADGRPVARSEGASMEHYSLCRCGSSQNKPFCSGMHWYVDFHDPVPDPDRTPTMFEWVGGLPALLRMTSIFYEKYVPEDPLIGPLFASMAPDHPVRVASWLGEVFGGPNAYSGRYGGYTRMLGHHSGKCITEDQRARWLSLLSRSADEAGLARDPEFRSAFMSYLEWGTRLAVENSQPDSVPPPNMPMPTWSWGTAGPPGGRVSALAGRQDEPAEPPVALPGPDEQVSFERHVRTFFRRRDRESMQFVFDLWEYDDVSTHAEAILGRLRDGSMPCDGAWPAEQLATFQRWVESGKAP